VGNGPWRLKQAPASTDVIDRVRLAAVVPLHYDEYSMQPVSEHPSVDRRAQEKQASREDDARALQSGQKSPRRLVAENEVFSPLARDARVDLAASRSLG
jgi:hypothetical protein